MSLKNPAKRDKERLPNRFFLMIPLLMTKDGEDFLITCKELSIYISEANKERAKKKFEESVDVLFDKLIEKGNFVKYLGAKNLIFPIPPSDGSYAVRHILSHDWEQYSEMRLTQRARIPKDLELGTHKRLEIPLAHC